MSTCRLSSMRKRRSDDELSDESDEDLPPVKKQRTNRETSMFPLSLIYIKEALTSKCHNVYKWLADLPLRIKFKQTLMASVKIDIDDKVKDGIISIADEDDIKILNNELDLELALNNGGESSYFQGSSNGFQKPFASTPFYRDGTMVGFKPNVSPMNGYHSKVPKPKSSLKKPHKQPKSSNRCIAPITNPKTDIEILLDPEEVNLSDSDDLRPVSHTSSGRRPSEFSRQTVSQVSMFDTTSIGSSGSSRMMNGGSSMSKRKSFTAHNVVRLQEKAQYELLLEKMVRCPVYGPVKKKTPPVEVDLTNEEDEKTVSNIKKETLHMPIDEMYEKYYKSCQLVSKPRPLQKQPIQRTEDVDIHSQPLPVYRPKTKSKPDFFSSDWITELKSSIIEETEKRIQIVKQEEDKIKRHRERREAKFAEEKRRLELCKIPGDVFPEPSSGKNDFPDLTAEMEKMVEAAFQQKSNDVLVTHKDMKITREMLRTLSGSNWLMDEVINFYLNLLVERSQLDSTLPSVYVFSTFFFASIKRNNGVKSVLRWTRKVDIFSYDFLLIPLHLEFHWALIVVDNYEKSIKYYDSMANTGRLMMESIQEYLVAEMKDKKKIDMDREDYSLQLVGNLPRQLNGSDCGMFTLRFAEYVSRKANINFNQGHMDYFRRRTAYEILTKKLL